MTKQTINGVYYEILTQQVNKQNGNVLLWVKRPKGKKIMSVVKYPSGHYSQVS